MKVAITFDLGDDDRRAIANYYGKDVPASHSQCRSWIENAVRADLEVVKDDDVQPKQS